MWVRGRQERERQEPERQERARRQLLWLVAVLEGQLVWGWVRMRLAVALRLELVHEHAVHEKGQPSGAASVRERRPDPQGAAQREENETLNAHINRLGWARRTSTSESRRRLRCASLRAALARKPGLETSWIVFLRGVNPAADLAGTPEEVRRTGENIEVRPSAHCFVCAALRMVCCKVVFALVVFTLLYSLQQ